jgi:cytochrome d ubiquinol oxidase subunit II
MKCMRVAGAVALAGIYIVHSDAGYLFDHLTSRALPLVVISAVAGLSALGLLLRHHGDAARVAAALAVATVIWGWALAQWPYMFPISLTVDAAAAPSTTLVTMFVVAAIAGLLVLPSLGLLLHLSRQQVLDETPRTTTASVSPPRD